MGGSISARGVIHDLIPKLKVTEHFLSDTLTVNIESSPDLREKLRLQGLKAEFELEIAMIRMNLEHLLKRYADQLSKVGAAEGKGDIILELDEHEAVAVQSIKRLYQRTHELETDTGRKFE